MTPNDIEILIHFHCSNSLHPRAGDNAVDGAITHLEVNGLIIKNSDIEGNYHTTDRGKAHVEQLCSLCWPVCKWIAADGKIIEI